MHHSISPNISDGLHNLIKAKPGHPRRLPETIDLTAAVSPLTVLRREKRESIPHPQSMQNIGEERGGGEVG